MVDAIVGIFAAGALYVARATYLFAKVYSPTKAVAFGGAIRHTNTPLFWAALALTAATGFTLSRYFRLLG